MSTKMELWQMYYILKGIKTYPENSLFISWVGGHVCIVRYATLAATTLNVNRILGVI